MLAQKAVIYVEQAAIALSLRLLLSLQFDGTKAQRGTLHTNLESYASREIILIQDQKIKRGFL